MERLFNADRCMGLEMIAWVHYPNSGSNCYVYPRFAFDGDKWLEVDESTFPIRGSFQARVAANTTLPDMREDYGTVLIARFNSDLEDNYYFDEDDPDASVYTIAINPQMGRRSNLEFKALSGHPFSSELVQVIDISDNVTFLERFDSGVNLLDGSAPLCRTIVVRKDGPGGSRCFGPFEHSLNADGTLRLSAIAANDFRITRFDDVDSAIMEVRDKWSESVASFVPKETVVRMLSQMESDDLIDWLPDTELIEVLSRAIKASEVFSSFGVNQIRAMKSSLRSCSDDIARVRLDGTRVERMEGLLSSVEEWLSLPEEVLREVLGSISDDRLASVVLDDRYYPSFRERILESAGVRERVARERKDLEASLADLKERYSLEEQKWASAKEKAVEAERMAQEANEKAETLREAVLRDRQEDLEKLDRMLEAKKAEIESAEGDIRRAKVEYERAIAEKYQVENEIERIIDGIENRITASSKIMENEILRKVVDAVYGMSLRSSEEAPDDVQFAIRENEWSLTDGEVVDLVHDYVTKKAGRQVSRNDAVNYLICMTQGFITTFAGQPGTGKTSLCNILADALGLRGSGAARPRFEEINVENGWTSYKDYIGYWNPLAKSYEKANSAVYDAMELLDREGFGEDLVPPFLFLLDEANLSSIEHYWSPFLRACDNFMDQGTRLVLGGSAVWHLPPHMRFLATVNSDHTTEDLSPRFLDRSWVIVLEPGPVGGEFERLSSYEHAESEPAFSYKRLLKAFGPQVSSERSREMEELLDGLAVTCKQHSFAVSQRSQLMMHSYVCTAASLMDVSSQDDQMAPVDYAFSQKVLPLIGGPAEYYDSLVDDLLEKAKTNQLRRTRRLLERMRRIGKENGFYQFFA